MRSRRWLMTSIASVSFCVASQALAQTPGVLYSWNSAGVQDWSRNFGAANTKRNFI